ncbi:MAG TPA: CoA transferase [Acidimicrobiia bacterium]|nr:CoA transferase [Acidimicrobiia bacterium]
MSERRGAGIPRSSERGPSGPARSAVDRGLEALRVVDFSFGIAGGYCCRLLADAGADVVKVEPPEGDPWRAWTAGDAPVDPVEGSALFRFLHHGVRSVAGQPGDALVEQLVASADVVVDSFAADEFDAPALCARHPGLVVLSITPFGRTGPYAGRPCTEFTVQAESGGLAGRGGPDQVPIMAGGRISEWVAGTFAAVAVAAAARYARLTGHGEHIDFSVMETMNIAGGSYGQLAYQLAGSPPVTTVHRTFETPSIEPTLDGYVGFCTNSRAQFDAFLELIERRDLLGDAELATFAGRQKRWTEWNEAVHAWTTRHTTADVVKRASELRIPVAPVLDGDSIFKCEHFRERGVFVDDPTGTFKMPRPAWRLDDEDPPPPRAAPRLGEHTGRVEARPVQRAAPTETRRLPLDGVRVIDLTAWWAGPVAAGMIAMLGADVIHVESVGRIDGMRMTGRLHGSDGEWWERATHYLCANANKRNLTLDLTRSAGRELLARLVRESDAIIENFTPRVMANFGFTRERIRELNDRCILVRMPAFGLSGPWRDNSGFAQTMEQVSGLAWITGHAYDQPRIQRGPSDPNAGMHAAFALVVGLARRDATGLGSHFEVTMVEGALNAAAEIAIERSAYGNVLGRDGNRGPHVAPQGLYRCAGFDRWLAVSVATDEHWRGLRAALGDPGWAADPALDTYAGRRARHDFLDERIGEWCAPLDADHAATVLLRHGVPAAAPRDARLTVANPQLAHRGFHEDVDHPVVGRRLVPTVPFRFASLDAAPGGRWIRHPAPLLGQHNAEILTALGVDPSELAELERTGIIGTRPAGEE